MLSSAHNITGIATRSWHLQTASVQDDLQHFSKELLIKKHIRLPSASEHLLRTPRCHSSCAAPEVLDHISGCEGATGATWSAQHSAGHISMEDTLTSCSHHAQYVDIVPE